MQHHQINRFKVVAEKGSGSVIGHVLDRGKRPAVDPGKFRLHMQPLRLTYGDVPGAPRERSERRIRNVPHPELHG